METNNLDALVRFKKQVNGEKPEVKDYSKILPNFNKYMKIIDHILEHIQVYKDVPMSQRYYVKKICLTGLYAVKNDISMYEFEQVLSVIHELDNDSKYTIMKFKQIIDECPIEFKRIIEAFDQQK